MVIVRILTSVRLDEPQVFTMLQRVGSIKGSTALNSPQNCAKTREQDNKSCNLSTRINLYSNRMPNNLMKGKMQVPDDIVGQRRTIAGAHVLG
jgi:hypothetical protein